MSNDITIIGKLIIPFESEGVLINGNWIGEIFAEKCNYLNGKIVQIKIWEVKDET